MCPARKRAVTTKDSHHINAVEVRHAFQIQNRKEPAGLNILVAKQFFASQQVKQP